MSQTHYCVGCRADLPVASFDQNEMTEDLYSWCRECRGKPQPASQPRQSKPRAAAAPRAPKPGALDLRPAPPTGGEDWAPAPVLVINSYGGSLLLAARSVGADVIGSYEDSAFGTAQQVENFPELEGRFASHRRHWPEGPLPEDAVVIAHPPCAAFSIQAKGNVQKRGAYGVDSDHFKCTVDVLRYSMGRRAAAICVESVPGALEGARAVHDGIAAEHGYRVFRVLQNAATFGLPQWRVRFWAIFMRSDMPERLALVHRPRARPLAAVLDSAEPGPPDEAHELWLRAQRQLLAESRIPETGLLERPGMLARNVQIALGTSASLSDVAGAFCVGSNAPECVVVDGEGKIRAKGYRFVSRTLRVLDPVGLAPVILADSWFVYRGRCVTPAEYRAIMGFPRDYRLDGEYRKWLSKGVCPPVAAWVLEQVRRAVSRDEAALPDRGVHWCEAGGTVDLCPTRQRWAEMAGVPADAESGWPEVPVMANPPAVPERPAKPGAEPYPPREGCGCSEVSGRCRAHREADERAAARAAARAARPAGVGGRKRRVTATYRLTLPPGSSAGDAEVTEAFRGREGLMVPPLKQIVGWERPEGDGAAVVLQAQYEPPNAGGHVGDVDRVVIRAAKLLGGASWERLSASVERA